MTFTLRNIDTDFQIKTEDQTTYFFKNKKHNGKNVFESAFEFPSSKPGNILSPLYYLLQAVQYILKSIFVSDLPVPVKKTYEGIGLARDVLTICELYVSVHSLFKAFYKIVFNCILDPQKSVTVSNLFDEGGKDIIVNAIDIIKCVLTLVALGASFGFYLLSRTVVHGLKGTSSILGMFISSTLAVENLYRIFINPKNVGFEHNLELKGNLEKINMNINIVEFLRNSTLFGAGALSLVGLSLTFFFGFAGVPLVLGLVMIAFSLTALLLSFIIFILKGRKEVLEKGQSYFEVSKVTNPVLSDGEVV